MSFLTQWTLDGEDIPGETGTTYVVQPQDEGKALAFRVTASNPFGSMSATSTAVVIHHSSPVISGTPPPTTVVGSPYAGFTPTVEGGVLPYVFSLSAGTLPTGLALNSSTGAITGTSTLTETKTGIVLRVTDALSHHDDLAAFSIASGAGVTPGNFAAAVLAAAPGDVLVLTAGTYAAYSKTGIVKAAPGVTILGSATTTFPYISLTNCAGLTFKGMAITGAGQDTHAVTLNNCQRMVLDGLIVASSPEAGSGILLRGTASSDTQVINCAITAKSSGVATLNADDVLIRGNTITRTRVDAIQVQGGTNITVDANLFTNPQVSAGHPDCIQFGKSFDAGVRPSNVTITNNNFDRQGGAGAQFIFLENSDNVTIDGNAGFGTFPNGVSLSRCTQVVATNTFVQSWDFTAKFIVRNGSDHVTFTTDFAHQLTNYNDGTPNTNVTITNNTIIPNATSASDRTLYEAFLAANPSIPVA